MKISSYGGVIAAANEESAFPLRTVGNTTAVGHIVSCFQQAGVFPIVIISGAEEDEVRYQLSSRGVVFLHLEKSQSSELFGAVKAGLTFLEDSCGKVVFTPVNTPMFTPRTLQTLMATEGEIVSPSFEGRGGHPIVLSAGMVPDILAYQGAGGLRGAVDAMGPRRTWVPVDDPGILYTVRDGNIASEQLARYNETLLHLAAQLSLQKGATVFEARTKLLLLLIWKNRSVRAACRQMALSYSKAWEMLNTLEESLAVRLVVRRHGGARGGGAALTEQGLTFLREYQRLEEDTLRFTQVKFRSLNSMLRF